MDGYSVISTESQKSIPKVSVSWMESDGSAVISTEGQMSEIAEVVTGQKSDGSSVISMEGQMSEIPEVAVSLMKSEGSTDTVVVDMESRRPVSFNEDVISKCVPLRPWIVSPSAINSPSYPDM